MTASLADPRPGEGDALTLSIIMPVYNERETVERAIAAVLGTELPVLSTELIVVDDGSVDGTRDILTAGKWPTGVEVVLRDRNGGKGAAIRTGLEHVRGTFTAILDADLEYDPADIGRLLPRLLAGESQAVYGVRGFASHSAFSFWYVMGNKAVTLVTNVLYNSWIADVMTCHKVVRTELFKSLRLREAGFAIEPEITARLLRAGVRIYEVPITYTARTREQGKKLTALDGLRVLRTLVRCRVR